MTSFYKKIKNFLDGNTKTEVEQEIISAEDNLVKLTPYEEKLNVLYMGCYNVNPTNPTITTEIGNVHNQTECIKAGQEAEYKYVALQNGNECLATNNPNFSGMESVLRKNCNMVCDEATAGFCGGVLKNQIYATSIVNAVGNEYLKSLVSGTSTSASVTPSTPAKEPFRHLENFASHNKEMKTIGRNLSQKDMICQEPINKYNLFLSFAIILLLAHILFSHIYSKKTISI